MTLFTSVPFQQIFPLSQEAPTPRLQALRVPLIDNGAGPRRLARLRASPPVPATLAPPRRASGTGVGGRRRLRGGGRGRGRVGLRAVRVESAADGSELDVREDDVAVGNLLAENIRDAAVRGAGAALGAELGRSLRVGGVEPAHVGIALLRISARFISALKGRGGLTSSQSERTRTMGIARASDIFLWPPRAA